VTKGRGASREPVGIGRLLREVREARGLTQGQLAARAGITQSAVSQIESGVRPNPNLMTLHLLERALGDPPVRLAYVDVAPSPGREACEKFLKSKLAREFNLTQAEADELCQWQWYGSGEVPSEESWADFVRLRRRVQSENTSER
jgi:transcriptional regulator with XRE-family HTH domain